MTSLGRSVGTTIVRDACRLLRGSTSAFGFRYQHSTNVQEAYNHPDTDSQSVDPTLFELASTNYLVGDRLTVRYGNAPSAAQNRIALSSLYQGGQLDKALKTLRELQALQADIQPYALFAKAALDSARKGDHNGALSWLKLVPPARSLTKSKKKGATASYTRAFLCDLLSTLQQNGQADTLWRALLIVANLGFVMSDLTNFQTQKLFSGPTRWLMLQGEYSQQWKRCFWQHFLTQVAWSQAHESDRAELHYRREIEYATEASRKDIRVAKEAAVVLCDCYNAIIQAYTLAEKLDVALSWAEMDAVFHIQLSTSSFPDVHVLRGDTWNNLMHAIFDSPEGIDEKLLERARKLHLLLSKNEEIAGVQRIRLPAKEREEKPSQKDERTPRPLKREEEIKRLRIDRRVGRLARDGQGILDGRSKAGNVPYFETFADKAGSLLDAGLYAELASALNEALDSRGFFPDAVTMAKIIEHGEDEHLSEYLLKLSSSKAIEPQLLRANMIEMNERGKHLEALQRYFFETNDNFLRHLFTLVLSSDEQAVVWPAWFDARQDRGDIVGGSLIARNYLNAVAMRSLLGYLRHDPDRLQTLYTAWIEGVERFRRKTESKRNDDVSASAVAHFAPDRSHFVAFLRFLPAAFTLRARNVAASSDNAPEATTLAAQLQSQAKAWTMTLANDAKAFGAALGVDMINLMLDTLIRNLNAFDEHYEEDVTRIHTLLDSVGIQRTQTATTTTTTTTNDLDVDARQLLATPLTFAYVIRAYLSVQANRGGPMLSEAKAMYEAFRTNELCQRMLQSQPQTYGRAIKHAEDALNDVQTDVERLVQRKAWQSNERQPDRHLEEVKFS